MAEVLGVASSIIGIFQLTGKLVSLGYGFIGGIKRAPKEIRALANELISLSQVLDTLQEYADNHPESPALQRLNEKAGPLQVCTQELKELESVLELKGNLDRFMWPLKEKDTLQYIAQIERHKSLFIFALTADQM